MIHNILSWIYIAAGVVFLFGAAIFVHEFGHFWVARKCGLKVEGFAIGFGPKIFAWTRDGIEYSVRWIPAGGFVKLPQMVTSAAIEGDKTGEEVPPAPPFSKILVAIAGPIMNVIFAFVVAGLIYYVGLPVLVNPSIIGYVEPGSPEAKLGISKGDRIIAVDGKPVKTWEDVALASGLALTNVIPVTIEHEGAAKPDTYLLKAYADNSLGIKTFNLESLNHLYVHQLMPGKPAEAANIKAGDEVIEFAGVPVTSQTQFISLAQKRGAQPTPIIVIRDGQRLTLNVTPVLDAAAKLYRIGVEFTYGKDIYQIEHPSPWSQVQKVVVQLYQTVTALVHSKESGVSAKELSGPVGIIEALAYNWSTDYRLALNFLVMLNINLAILNLLPVPVMDGGHILMAIIERIRRRPLGVQFVEYVTTAFAAMIIIFMLYVTFFDIKRISLFRLMFTRQTQIEQPEKTPAAAPAPAGGHAQPGE